MNSSHTTHCCVSQVIPGAVDVICAAAFLFSLTGFAVSICKVMSEVPLWLPFLVVDVTRVSSAE